MSLRLKEGVGLDFVVWATEEGTSSVMNIVYANINRRNNKQPVFRIKST